MKKVLFIMSGGVSDYVRCQLPAEEMAFQELADSHLQKVPADGKRVEFRGNEFDTVIISRPYISKLVLAYKKEGVRVIIDQDDNFHAIPPDHPGYKHIGRGNPAFLQELELSFSLADAVTVTTDAMATYMRQYNPNTYIIPNGWTARNLNWFARRQTPYLNIGWAGTITHRWDFLEVRDALIEIAHEYDNVRVFIGGDPAIYKLIQGLPEGRRFFVPMVDSELYPYTLAFSDIWLAPLAKTEFNKYKSDIKLVEAGARQLPAIASDTKYYSEWYDGTLISFKKDDWHKNLTLLVGSWDVRKELGQKNWEHVQGREMRLLVQRWMDVI